MTTPSSITSTLSTEDDSVIHSNLDDNTQSSEHFYSFPSSNDSIVDTETSSHCNRYSSREDEQSIESPSLAASNQTMYLLFEFFERSDDVFLCSLVSINRFCRLKLAARLLFHAESIGAIVLVPHLIVDFCSHVIMRQSLSHVDMSRVWKRNRQINQ
jgi:hypothetical protein